jgi:spore germination cell wall hydrolase CwlJ-like protein
MWREARGAGQVCMKAVGCSIRNRVQRPSWWGNNYIDVITKKWQYSSMAAPNDPQLIKYPQVGDVEFDLALQIASDVITGNAVHPMPGADSYFDDSISPPKWVTSETFCGKIGRITFYNLDQDVEAPNA